MLKKLVNLFQRHKKLAWFVILANALIALTKTVVDPIVLKLMVDDALTNKNMDLFLILVILSVFLSVGLRTGLYFIAIYKQKLINKMTSDKTGEMLGVYFQLPYQKVNEKGEGYYISRVYDEPAKVSQQVVGLSVSVFEAMLSLVGALAICIYLSWEVTFALLIIVPVLFALSRKYGSKIVRLSELEGETQASFREDMIRCLETYKLSRIFSLQQRVSQSALRVLGTHLDSNYERNKTSQAYQTLSNIFLSLAESAVLVIAALAVFFGSMTVGGLLAYMSGFWKMMNSIVGLVEQFPKLAHLSAFVDRINSLKDDAEKPLTSVANNVVLQHAAIGYGAEHILKDVSFQVDKGERCLIQGGNGSGKSTLLHAISGFIPLNAESHIPDQSRVSALLAPLTFFKGSLREHLKFDELEPSAQMQLECILKDFDLLDKLDDDPQHFSEGQKRKAQVALSLAKEADVYIFDEPLAAVDTNSKDIIMGWINRCTQNKTVFMVLHGDEKYHRDFNRHLALSGGQASLS
ncbi:ABC transporter ATP-binding protein [Rheinheimera sp. YQF-2]|uniref:ABC transporter ATP-binding protein n=1 Tax=Rheinheimera lutimaris TaxID=2740584 RepID=A0A7Y5EKH0_9GAMM|nr:ABC transporter ATP-binding protein [Rheinheimera lutimaris]NRQ44371.1 ABC transporter ATP-binding protein [Rheinheimera lutimaris]